MFDAWSLLLGWGAGQGLLVAVVLLTARGGNGRANVLLAALVLSFSSLLTELLLVRNDYCFYTRAGGVVPLLSPITFLVGPLYWWYARSLLGLRFSASDALHLVPALAIALNLSPTFAQVLQLGFPDGPTLLSGRPRLLPVSGYLELALFLSSLILYASLALRLLARFDTSVQATTSWSPAVHGVWLRRLAFLMIAIAIVVGAAAAGMVFAHRHVMGFEFAMALAFSLVVHATGVVTLRQPGLFAHVGAAGRVDEAESNGTPAPSPTESPRYERSGLSAESLGDLSERLRVHMRERRPYLDPELGRSELARQLGVTPHQLSQVLSEGIGTSFFDFVNTYRVEEVQGRLLDPESRRLTTLAVALDSGFASKSSFNRVFKKLAGRTPSQWIREQRLDASSGKKVSHPSG